MNKLTYSQLLGQTQLCCQFRLTRGPHSERSCTDGGLLVCLQNGTGKYIRTASRVFASESNLGE